MKFLLLLCVSFCLTVPFVTEANRIPAAGADGIPAAGADVIPAGGQWDGQAFHGEVTLQNPLDGSISSIPAFFRAIIEVLIIFAIPLVVFFIIWAGFLYVTARGDVGKIQQAHSALLYAVIGGLLILGANLLMDVITNTINNVR